MNKKATITLQNWLRLQSNSSNPLSYGDTILLWKGLFLVMFKADRPSIEEGLAEQMASLLHCFDKIDASIGFYSAFLRTLGEQWNAIDPWQKPKFVMLLRRVTRQCFVVSYSYEWDEKLVAQFSSTNRSISIEFLKQFTDIFLSELADMTARHHNIVGHRIKHIFDAFLYKSDLGRGTWNDIEFHNTSINDLELDNVDENKIGAEMIGLETNVYQPVKVIQKLNKNKRMKSITDMEVQTKKIKLCEVEKLKVRKMEHIDVEVDLMPVELPIIVNNSCQDSFNSSTNSENENIYSDSNSWDTPIQEERAEDFTSRRQQQENKVTEANDRWFKSDGNQLNSTGSSPLSSSTFSNVKKKVQIMLHLNKYQEPSEHYRQLISSPKIPYDRVKLPGKGLLKVNLVPQYKKINIRL